MHAEGPPSGGPSRWYKRRVRRVIPLLAIVLVAGCGRGDSAPKLRVSLLPKVVLQPQDVPRLARFDVGRITRFDAPEGARSDPARFGRLDGWKADYKKAGGTKTAGALVVHSQADLFETTDGARKDLDAYREQFRAGRATSPRSVALLEPHIGDDAAGVAIRQGGNPGLRIFTVAWTEGRVSASVTVNGFTPLTTADVLRLARRQERRILVASR
jgi:hypothetical protein